jgi:CheY-like chemotaxis protein
MTGTAIAREMCKESERSDVPPVAPLVLVVDDVDDIRELVAEALVSVGYRVRTASNGEAAFEQAQIARPDLIVLDLTMPVMSGWKFLELQGGDPELAGIAVVVMTSLEDAHPDGAAAVLRKPFSLHALLTTVSAVLGMSMRPLEGVPPSLVAEGACR